jgi:hypothetical protein
LNIGIAERTRKRGPTTKPQTAQGREYCIFWIVLAFCIFFDTLRWRMTKNLYPIPLVVWRVSNEPEARAGMAKRAIPRG